MRFYFKKKMNVPIVGFDVKLGLISSSIQHGFLLELIFLGI